MFFPYILKDGCYERRLERGNDRVFKSHGQIVCLYPADFASLTSFLSLPSDTFAWDIDTPSSHKYEYSCQPGSSVLQIKRGERSGCGKLKQCGEQVCRNFIKVVDDSGGFHF